MAGLIGQALRTVLGPGVNARLSNEIDGYGEEIQTAEFFSAHLSIEPGNASKFARIAAALRRAISGRALGSYAEDFYFRLHLSVTQLALGNILSEQEREVSLWNAFVYSPPLTLNSVLGEEEGLSISGPALPFTFAPNLEQVWLLTILTIGPFELDTTIVWTFDSGETVSLPITGSRIVVWPVPPDWSDGVRETLEWLSDVMRARDGVTQRRSLRDTPRRSIAFEALTEGQSRRLADALLADFGARVSALPMWMDGQTLAQDLPAGALSIPALTDGYDFVDGGLAILWRSVTSWEPVQITAVGPAALTLERPTLNAWPRGTRLWPLRSVRLVQPGEQSVITDAAAGFAVEFRVAEPAQWTAQAPAEMYLGWPVIERSPDRGDDIPLLTDRSMSEIDAEIVDAPVIRDHAGIGFQRQTHRHRLFGRAEQSALRALLYWLRGRQRAAWVPSWHNDLVPVATLLGNSLQIEWAGYSRFGRTQPGRRDIRIEPFVGAVSYHRITGASESGAIEQLSIDPPVVGSFEPAEIRRISFMTLSTLASDAVEWRHLTDSDGVADVTLEWEAAADEL